MEQKEKASFNIAIGSFTNFVKNRLRFELGWAEQGNCARWTSAGLEFAGLMGYKSMCPKVIWIRLFEMFGQKDPKNVNVVVYKKADHAVHTYGRKEKMFFNKSGTLPLSPLWNWSYFDIDKFANAIVEIPDKTKNAVVVKCNPINKPSIWRYRKSEIAISSCAMVYLGFKLIKKFR